MPTYDSTSTLEQEISDFKVGFVKQLPPGAADGIDEDIARQVASDATKNALQIGARLPDFTLPDVNGKDVTLSTLLEKGPVVLTFYRGEWCPYCNLQLHAYQQILPQIEELGATLVAVSPQTPDYSLSLIEKQNLKFTVLTDSGNKVAREYGLVYTVSKELHELYLKLGIDLEQYNGEDSWELPLSVTYVVDSVRIARAAFVDADFTHRMEPATIIAGIKDAKTHQL